MYVECVCVGGACMHMGLEEGQQRACLLMACGVGCGWGGMNACMHVCMGGGAGLVKSKNLT